MSGQVSVNVALAVCVLTHVFSIASAQLNWAEYNSLPAPRTLAQAVVVQHFVFVIGGTPQPLNLSAGDQIDPVLWLNLAHPFQFYPLTAQVIQPGASITPITGKQFAASDDLAIYVSYAASTLRPDNKMIRIELPCVLEDNLEDGVPANISFAPPSHYVRSRAALAKYVHIPVVPQVDTPSILDILPKPDVALYLFGGIDPNGNFVPQVETFYNGTWRTIAGVEMPFAWCDCATVHARGEIMISNCVWCNNGSVVDECMFYDPQINFFNYRDPREIGPPLKNSSFYLPGISGTAGGLSTFFAVTMYAVDNDNSSPYIVLYDQWLAQPNKVYTMGIQANRKDCATFIFGVNLYCMGGTLSGQDRATSFGDVAQLLPAPSPSVGHLDMQYAVGSNINVYAGLTCGGLETTMLRLTADPECRIPIPFVAAIPCGSPSTFATSVLKLIPGQALDMYLCFTDGTCAIGDRQPCGGGDTADNCRWDYCCWDNLLQECFSYGELTPQTSYTTYWAAVQATPVILYAPEPTPATPLAVYQEVWFKIVIVLFAALLMYFVVSFYWKYSVKKETSLREKEENDLITVFGKNYIILGEIGAGSFGRVFLAERTLDGRKVALKVLPCFDSKQRDAALAEYDVLHTLDHENMIHVLDLILSWDGQQKNRKKKKSRRAKRSQDELTNNSRASCTSNEEELRVSLNAANSPSPLNKPLLGGEETPVKSSASISQREDTPDYGALQASDLRASVAASMEAVATSSQRFLEDSTTGFIGSLTRFICIVSDYYPDGDLRNWVLNFGAEANSPRNVDDISGLPRIPEETIVDMMAQLCSLLSYLHLRPKPVVHRDLKPENILLDGRRIVVTDFGMASVQDDANTGATTKAGTLCYTAPETMRRIVGPPMDMWAVGCIIYAMCTRRVTTDSARIMFADVDDDDFQQSIRDDLQDYSTDLQDIVLSLLAKDPVVRCDAPCAMASLRALMCRHE